jgi:carboxypeptidase T
MKKQSILCLAVLALLLATSMPITGSQTDVSSFLTNDLVRINTNDGARPLLPRGAEIVGENPGEWVDIILQESRLCELSVAHIGYSVLIHDVDRYMQSFAGQYHTFAEIEQILHTIATTYPNITKLFSLGKSYQDRDIWCLEISDNPGVDEGEPGVFFMGLTHAREWPTVEICLNIVTELTSLYDSNTTIHDLVNSRRIWIAPCANPDGYYQSHDQGIDWRKNMHYFPQFGTTGVDLNRNYGGSCNGNAWGEWGSVQQGAAAHNPSNEVYCGPQPMSELEVQAVAKVFLENDICASISWHTYSELVLWPWGYATNAHTPDNTYLAKVGRAIAKQITRQSGSGTYTPEQSAALYPTTGDSDDWAYGYAHYILGRTTFAYTIEACSAFEPPENKLDQICAENFDGALYLLQEAENISTVTPRILPPTIDNLSRDADGTYTVSWQEQNPNAQPDSFQLDELTGLVMKTDDAEAGSSLWTLDGFTISSQHYHSTSQSYRPRNVINDVSTMTSVFPLPVMNTTTLSFWCWYDIENKWDYAFVEVSINNRSYDILDSFTGSSDGWIQKEYNLSAYAGKSLFLRFRYTTDERTTNEGFYVDDITPVPQYEMVTNLSSTITNTSYEITGKTNGTYYYRVRGHNNARGWGDYSALQKIIVGDGTDYQPPHITITQPKENYVYLGNRELFPFFTTFILGYLDVNATATDEFGVTKVEFYVDNTLQATDATAPYSWTWEHPAFFRHTLKLIAYDTSGNSKEQQLIVWKFF